MACIVESVVKEVLRDEKEPIGTVALPWTAVPFRGQLQSPSRTLSVLVMKLAENLGAKANAQGVEKSFW